jgi:hypothetical protein
MQLSGRFLLFVTGMAVGAWMEGSITVSVLYA